MPKQVNLVFQGGGVKGIAFVGALTALRKIKDIEVVGVGGVSAGAIVAALYAAGFTPDEMRQELNKQPFSKLVKGPRTGYLGWPSRIIWSNGVHTTYGLYDWLYKLLDQKEIHTFADIRTHAELKGRPCKSLRILAANITDQMIETISDESHEGDEVASAVAKSISIPIYFRPYIDGHRLFVDGGLLSNYPLWLFQDSPLTTVAFKLRSAERRRVSSGSWIVDYVWGLMGTMWSAHDKARRGIPSSVVEIPIDASFVSATNFKLEESKQELLFSNGMAAIGLVDWKALPETRPTVFEDRNAAIVLENTASALAKHLARSTNEKPNLRSYDFHNSTYFVRSDGSVQVEEHFLIRNHGPDSISMIESGTNYQADSDASFLDLQLEVECKESEPVVLPTLNSRTEKKFAIALVPAIGVGETREIKVRYFLPVVSFRDLVENKPDFIEVKLNHEKGVKKATLTMQLAVGTLKLLDHTGPSRPSDTVVLPGKTGLQWIFKDVPPPSWHFKAIIQRG